MREILNRLVAILALVSFLAIMAAIVFFADGKQIMHGIESGVVSIFNLLVTGLEIVFGTGLLLGVAYGSVKIWQATRVQVIRDGKDGQIARAAIHRGQVHQMYSTMFNALEQGEMQMKQLEYFEKAFKMMLQATKAADRLIDEEEYEEEEPLQIEGPKVYKLSDQIRNGQTVMDEESSVVGYVDGEALQGKLFANDGNMFDSVFIIGDTGFGKSTAAVYMAALTIYHGGRLIVIDPDAEFDQSLTARLGPLAHEMFLLCPIADTPEKAEHAVKIARSELESPGDYPVLWLIDEFSMIMRQATGGTGKWSEVGKSMTDLTEDWATRGRKRRRRVKALGQIPNAKRSGGTEFRDSATVMSFHMKKKRAQMVLDVDEAAIAPDLGMGEVIVIPARSSEASYRMQLPYPDLDGLRIIAETMVQMASRDGSEYGDGYRSVEPEPDLNHSRTGLEPLPEPIKISPELAFKARIRRVRELRRQNKNQSQIIETIYGVSKGGSPEYAKARDEYLSIMQLIAAEDAQEQGGI